MAALLFPASFEHISEREGAPGRTAGIKSRPAIIAGNEIIRFMRLLLFPGS
jgi:hypothetical protein